MRQEVAAKFRAKAAALRYGNPAKSLRILAVAGAAGKTTTARLIAEILKEADKTVAVFTNKTVEIGGKREASPYETSPDALQRQLATARKQHVDYVIVEVSEALVRSTVLETIPVDTAVVVAPSFTATALLDQPVNYAVVPSGYDTDDLQIAPHQVISFGDDETADARINSVTLYRKGTEVNLTIDHQTTFDLATHLIGRANAFNVAAAAATAYVLVVDLETLNDGIAELEQVPGNYQYVATDTIYTVAADSAHSDTAVELVVDSAKELAKRRLLVVLEAGNISDVTLQHVHKQADRLIVVAEHDPGIAGVDWQSDLDEASHLILRGAKQGDLVALIGPHFTETVEVDDERVSRTQRIVAKSS